MELLAELTKNETIALLGVIIAAIAGIIVPIISHLLKKGGRDSKHVEVGRLNGNGTTIGDKPVVTIDKRQGLDGELVLSKVMEEAEAKGRADEQIAQLKDELARAVERIRKLEAEGNRPDAEKALEELRESGDMKLLQKLLIKDRDEHRDALIQRNREIAAVAYLRGDIDISTEAVDEILKVLPDDLFALNQMGHIHRLRGQLKEAEDCYKRVLQLGRDVSNEVLQSAALGNLGLIYETRGELDMAKEMYLKSLGIAEKLGLQDVMAGDYGNLGAIYQKQGDFEKAVKMYRRILEIEEKLGRLDSVAITCGNLGVMYRRQGELDEAEEMHEKALEINEKLGRLEGMARQYGNLGLVYMDKSELDKAEEMQLQASDIDKKIGRLEGQAIRYGNLGAIYERRSNIGKAIEYCEKAVELYKRIGMPHEVEEVERWIEGIDTE